MPDFARKRPVLLSASLLLLLAGGVVGCDEHEELTVSELHLEEVEPSGPAAVDHLGRSWLADESGHQILVIDDDGQIVDQYELDGLDGSVEDIEVTETHVYVLTVDDAEPVMAKAGRNDVAPSAWETFPIPADNLDLRDVTGLRRDTDGVISLELAFGRGYLPLFTADGNLDVAAAPLALPIPRTHVLFDVSGYIPAGSDYVPVGPTRLLDTRLNGQEHVGALKTNDVIEVTVAGRDGIPQGSGIDAVVLNVTVTQPQVAGWLAAYPNATFQNTSSINFAQNESTAGLVIIRPGADNKISLRHVLNVNPNPIAGSHVIVDVFGYFPSSANIDMVTPVRVFDSRLPQFGAETVKAGIPKDVQFPGVPQGVGAVIANVTVVSPVGNGFATVYPAGTMQPATSNLNYTTGAKRSNLVIIPLSNTGKATIYSTQSAHYIVDVLGWFGAGEGADFQPISPVRLRDTRINEPALEHTWPIDIDVPDGMLAVFGNLTAVQPTARGFLQAYPDPNVIPITSNVNFNAGNTVANAVLTAISPGDQFRVRANFY